MPLIAAMSPWMLTYIPAQDLQLKKKPCLRCRDRGCKLELFSKLASGTNTKSSVASCGSTSKRESLLAQPNLPIPHLRIAEEINHKYIWHDSLEDCSVTSALEDIKSHYHLSTVRACSASDSMLAPTDSNCRRCCGSDDKTLIE